MVQPLGVVLIGIGGYGASYVRWMEAESKTGRACVRAVIDPMAEKSSVWPAVAAQQIPRFDTFDRFRAADLSAELAVISSPIALHAEHCTAALDAGMHVLCEKPLCADLVDADRMIAAREQAGRLLSVGYQWSHSVAVQALKADIQAGRWGAPVELRTCVAWARRASYYGRNRWAGRIRDEQGRAVYDSPVNNATAHYLHNMLYVLGRAYNRAVEPTAVAAELYRANAIENFDAACCRIDTDIGVPLVFISAHCVNSQSRPALHYRFEEAVVSLDDTSHLIATRNDGTVKDYGVPDADSPRKLTLSIDWASKAESGCELCGVEAAMMHTRCVNALQQMPITNFAADAIVRDTDAKGDTLTYVPGLAEAMADAFGSGKLFSEMNLAWAAPASHVDLAPAPKTN